VISEKISCRQISRGKIVQGNTWGEKYPALKKITYKKNLIPLYVGEKNSSSRGLGKKLLP